MLYIYIFYEFTKKCKFICVPNNVKFHLFSLSEFQLLMGLFVKKLSARKNNKNRNIQDTFHVGINRLN